MLGEKTTGLQLLQVLNEARSAADTSTKKQKKKKKTTVVVAGSSVDLVALYNTVQERGGWTQVINSNRYLVPSRFVT